MGDSYAIGVELHVPEQFRNIASYVFRQFARIWGIPVRIQRETAVGSARIVYGTDDEAQRRGTGTVVIPFDAAAFAEATPFEARRSSGRALWTRQGDTSPVPDLISSTYRLLRMLDESQVLGRQRDRRGIFNNDALPAARRAVDAVPLVEEHAAFLLDKVASSGGGATSRRVPSGRGGNVLPWP